MPKVIAKCCLKCNFFHGALYCCVRYLNIEYQNVFFKSTTQKVIAKSSVGCKFHDLKYLEFGIYVHFP